MLTVITGPPCSGKSTYARSHAEPGHIVIDYDQLAQALGSTQPHEHPPAVRYVAVAARRAAINAAIIQHQRGATVWLVHTTIPAAEMARYRAAGAEIITLEVDAAELHRRADVERPELWHRLIDRWQPITQPKPRAPARPIDTRGRHGRPWRRARAAVLAASTVCWVCGHDGADSVDHVDPLALGGAPLDPSNLAPAHHAPCPTCRRRCNSERGARPGRGDQAQGEAAGQPTPTPHPTPVTGSDW